jgi:glycogen debranching enzyme
MSFNIFRCSHFAPSDLARDISRAASHFLLNQLPELYGGLQRDATNFPVQYLGANVPQAWAAGTPFMLLQAMLGLQQDAPRGKLYVVAESW